MQLIHYARLMRLHKPIGIFLLLWPTLWALWLASAGKPNLLIVSIFVVGVIVMRSAGCIINDFADREIDKHVERTRDRPLTSGLVTTTEALILFFILITLAFILILFLNHFTILLAFAGLFFAVTYPFLKRVTHLPQIGLGLAYAWGVPMAFAAENNSITPAGWEVFAAALLWPVMYDTLYAMVDRSDDLKIGVKSTAILFAHYDRFMIAILQIIFLILLVHIGFLFKLTEIYFLGLFFAGLLFVYQQWLIRSRDPKACFKAFLNNNWVGLIIFFGVVFA
ncbi:MAG: 4-hydroxybenzoate octaprenyltransferase [Gammaproteobacteria bacterium]